MTGLGRSRRGTAGVRRRKRSSERQFSTFNIGGIGQFPVVDPNRPVASALGLTESDGL